eukprot:170860-Pyramimonas_sp.AAC.1
MAAHPSGDLPTTMSDSINCAAGKQAAQPNGSVRVPRSQRQRPGREPIGAGTGGCTCPADACAARFALLRAPNGKGETFGRASARPRVRASRQTTTKGRDAR